MCVKDSPFLDDTADVDRIPYQLDNLMELKNKCINLAKRVQELGWCIKKVPLIIVIIYNLF